MNDAHCHFFSSPFFAALGRGLADLGSTPPDEAALARLGWERPGPAEQLADRWAAELDRHHLSRAALMASVPGDADSVVTAVQRHDRRFVGFAMVDPMAPDAAGPLRQPEVKALCLFPALHGYALWDPSVRSIVEAAASRPGTAVFVHCGVLSIGARRILGLPNSFDARRGNPLDLQPVAAAFPTVPIIVPHFGAGFFREALMLADACPNVVFDTSSSNGWMRYHTGLTLPAVFEQTLAVVGPERVVFGSDSSFFPRGWVGDVYAQQKAAIEEIGVGAVAAEQIFSRNFDRLFPLPSR